MRKPKLNERTIARLTIWGQAWCGKYYYELKDFMDPEGNHYTELERTNLRDAKVDVFDWGKYTKKT